MSDSVYLSVPGVICGAGSSIDQVWNSCLTGNRDGIKRVTAIGGKEFFAGKIDDSLLDPVDDARYDMRIIRIVNRALMQILPAVEKVKAKYGADRVAVCLGACDNGSQFSLAGHRAYFETEKFPAEYKLDIQSADYPAAFIKEKCGITGPSYVFATACSSSASAIIKARDMMLAGFIDAAIVGGVDIASDTVLLGFDSLEAVSDEKTNPFSKNRKGITLGEGAALFVMSKDAADFADTADGISVRLLGAGESSDASHMTAPLEDGSGAAQAISEALKDAGLKPEQIDYLNLHGTGTHLNDAMESKAVSAVFGEACRKLPVSSTKPLMGHTLGASGAIELAICSQVLREGAGDRLPVHVWDGEFDEALPALNFVEQGAAGQNGSDCKKEMKIVMSNSFGFGGCNVSLIIGK